MQVLVIHIVGEGAGAGGSKAAGSMVGGGWAGGQRTCGGWGMRQGMTIDMRRQRQESGEVGRARKEKMQGQQRGRPGGVAMRAAPSLAQAR